MDTELREKDREPGENDKLKAENLSLKEENKRLKAEIERLKAQLGIREPLGIFEPQVIGEEIDGDHPEPIFEQETPDETVPSSIHRLSAPKEKIRLFMSLFKGRDDVFAKRYENKKKESDGYVPACNNGWKSGLCRKPKGRCADCPNKDYPPLDETVVDNHLRGHFVAGIYPLLLDETCYFLAIDFDKGEWRKDIATFREVCAEFKIPVAIERSRSGQGAHVWFFFTGPLPAVLARKFGSALLTYAMSKRHEITFKSYDRFFPNQDFMPKGGLGNLIALPLQKAARQNCNSEFIDENFQAYRDQWAFLAGIQKIPGDDIEALTAKLCQGQELGVLKKDEEEAPKPWETIKVKLGKSDFPPALEIVKANMLFIPKTGISQRALNQLKRLAAFQNPLFYKAQAMRLPVREIPRIISCSEETGEYLCLPRGCEPDLIGLFQDLELAVNFLDKTNHGKNIDPEFQGSLRDEQPLALAKLLRYDNGILSATTAFGKTVVAVKLIAEKKVNTLILVNKVSLVSQWKKRLQEFLTIKECLADNLTQKEIPPGLPQGRKRGTNKSVGSIGQLGAGKDALSGIIDIGVMQSIYRMGEVKDCVRDYGMVIVDECHHVSAQSFEEILKQTNAQYVYGLTATPTRKDGHHPILFMQCGPIRYRDDAKKQAEKRPFEHYIVPRFTSLRVPMDKDEKDVSIQELYSEIVVNEMRNQLIIDDVVKCHENGRNCLVLTERTAHVELLAAELGKRISPVLSLTGGMGVKETREILQKIAATPKDKQLTLIATGQFIGEGFDEPRLDTLFLTMPISWKGTLQQYAGRLHRLYTTKTEVHIYDYVDIQVRMLEKMYNKRLNGYAAIGYKAKGEIRAKTETLDIIFDKSSFLPVYHNDIRNARREILIVSPYVAQKRTLQVLQHLENAIESKVKVIVVTRPAENFRDKELTAWRKTVNLLKEAGISLVFRSNIHQKFAVMDQRIVWYGSINLLSFGSAEESIMRLESSNIANKLIKIIL